MNSLLMSDLISSIFNFIFFNVDPLCETRHWSYKKKKYKKIKHTGNLITGIHFNNKKDNQKLKQVYRKSV